MSPEERVRHLMQTGAVAHEEGERLLSAMSDRSSSARSFVRDPFERIGGGTAAAIGAVVSVASLFVARLGVRFDGLLDLHSPHVVPSWRTAIVNQLAAWIVPSLCFWVYARVMNRHVRAVDFFGAVGLSRFPLLVAGLVTLPLVPSTLPMPPKPSAALLALVCITLVFAAMNVWLLYKGFKNASGLTGSKLVAGFIGLLVVGEAISKAVLFALS